jgi:hypothetical protein
MPEIDLEKFAAAEQRHPHKQIIELLISQVEFESDGTPVDPFWPRDLFRGSIKHADLASFSDDDVAMAIDDLIDEGTVAKKDDPHVSNERIGITELIDAHEAPYERLKDGVYEKAKAAGLWPKWRRGLGWYLVDGGGNVVEEGPMQALDRYLDEQTRSAAG